MVTRFAMPVVLLAVAGTGLAQTAPPPTQSAQPTAQPNVVPGTPTTPAPGGTVPHTPDPSNCPPDAFRSPADRVGGQFWGSAEYLVWWVQGQRVPALVTSSPAGTPVAQSGVLGVPGTTTLFGGSRINEDARSGFRVTAGVWLDDCRTCGIGGEFFMLGDNTDGFSARSGGSPILARPFRNTLTGLQDAQLVAYPGIVSGGVAVSTESQFLVAGILGRHLLCEGCGCGGRGYRVEALAGYRYLYLNERIGITEQLQTTSTAVGAPPVGTGFLVSDSVVGRTQFHGGDIGLVGQLTKGRWSLDMMGRLGIGANVQEVVVAGNTQVAVPGQPAVTLPGGLYSAGQTGQASDCAFALVPEFRLGVGYRITDRARVTFGYNLLWWTNVVRPGDQINATVNPNLLAPALGLAPAPAIPLRDSTLWVQGFNVGLAFNY